MVMCNCQIGKYVLVLKMFVYYEKFIQLTLENDS